MLVGPKKVVEKPEKGLDGTSYKLYYVNFRMDLISGPHANRDVRASASANMWGYIHPTALFPARLVNLLFLGWLCCAILREFVVDVLFEQVGIGSYQAAAIDEDGWRAVDFQ